MSQSAELFNLDGDDTLFQWNEFKDVLRESDKLSDCTPGKILKKLTESKPTLGNMYPNIEKLLKVTETMIISTSAVERVFSKIKLIVTEHRNRLKVQTTNKLLMISTINKEKHSDMDFKKVVNSFLKKKPRKICQRC